MRTRILSTAAIAALALGMVSTASPPAHAAALDDSDFIEASGSVLRTNHGTGDVINLRGTNLGGWLTYEDWMSPLGEFALSRDGWSVTGSSSGASAAIDGDLDTRWTSGAAQAGSEWIQIDLGSPTLMSRITLDAGPSANDWPASYEVLVSDNGTTWRSVAAASGSPTTAVSQEITTTRFAPQVARYVRVEQEGARSNWWSIAEINLFSDPTMHNGSHSATASVTGSGLTAGAALDGNISTAWATGTAQVPGQSFTVDLGGMKEFNKILFDSGAGYPNDYPASYAIEVSSDGTTWTKVASGYGTNRLITEDLWTSTWARYIKITQTGTKSNWWAISEIAITAGTNFDRTGWVVTASNPTGTAAIKDGDLGTRWTTSAAQSNGQYIQVDFGATMTFNNIVLDNQKNTSSETDYPRGYSVSVSSNGSTWQVVATGQGDFKATNINFPAATGRYVRVTQTGTSGSWWSIGEMSVGLNSDDYSLRLELQDRFGATVAQEIYDTHKDTWVTEADLDNMVDIGINTIRLPIGWNELLNLDGTWKSNPWEYIDWLVAQAGERGMYVILDLHTVPGGGCPWGSCGRMGPNPNEFWGNTTYQDWVVDMWEAIAERYEGNPAVAGYDLINEPLIDYGEDADDVNQKSAVYDRIYDAVRAIDPDHTIFIAAFFGWDKIAAPSVYGWTNVVYELHPYDMPGGKDWTAQNNVVTQQLTEVAAKLSSPGIPVLYGEYSFYYYDDVWARFMAGLNGMDVSWTTWAYKVKLDQNGGGGYWGLYNSNNNQVPVINSDDADAFKTRLGKFGTASFSANEPFIRVVSQYAGGSDDYSPVLLSTAGWTATASSIGAGETYGAAFDGDQWTRWSTGASQTPGQWFRVDMGSARTISQIVMTTRTDQRWDYADRFTIEVSTNGTTWTTVASGPGFGWKRSVGIDPVSARYIRITQTGTATEWWQIAELQVYAP